MNRGDRDSNIYLSNIIPKRLRQNHLAKPTFGTWQSACIKEKTLVLANIIYSIFTTLFIPKSHIYIVIVLTNLNTRCDNFCLDRSFSLIKMTVRKLYIRSFNLLLKIILENIEIHYQIELS